MRESKTSEYVGEEVVDMSRARKFRLSTRPALARDLRMIRLRDVEYVYVVEEKSKTPCPRSFCDGHVSGA